MVNGGIIYIIHTGNAMYKSRRKELDQWSWFALRSVNRSGGVINIVLTPAAVRRGQCELPAGEKPCVNWHCNHAGSCIALV